MSFDVAIPTVLATLPCSGFAVRCSLSSALSLTSRSSSPSLAHSTHSLLQEQNRSVAKKLGTATLLMFTLPIIAFYVGLYCFFTDKDEPILWSGGLAVVVTNLVIAGYVVSAFREEDESDGLRGSGGNGDGDEAGPRVGAFKQRTD